MKLETKFCGVLDVEEKEIITFIPGLPGFEKFSRFLLLRYNDASLFFVLQSVEKPDLAFILVGFEKVLPGFDIELTDGATSDLGLEKPDEALVFAIVNIPGDLAQATVNLAAPVIINQQARKGRQIIIENSVYGLKHPLFMQEAAATAECTSQSAVG